MGNANDVASLVEMYWTINKVAHDPSTKDFLSHCQSHTIKVDGKPYKYYQRGSGPTVLLVHGVHSNLGSMVPIAQSLVDEDYQVVLFDAPAHGEALGSTTNPLEVRELIREMCGRLGELHAVIAHSLGGLWALSAWHSDLRAKTFVSISTPSSKRFLVDMFAAMYSLDDDLVQGVVGEIEGLLGEGVWTEYSPSEIVKEIDVPGLVIHGADDGFVPPQHAQELHANWRQSTLEMVDGASHLDVVRSPRVLTLISAYLQEAK
ncbi:MAG TPA: alpha/beta hydrolase [Streptosporangiaceae bacterium]|nr:alpha/beta hydrolase [Streptosporangiaceae bacterium]